MRDVPPPLPTPNEQRKGMREIKGLLAAGAVFLGFVLFSLMLAFQSPSPPVNHIREMRFGTLHIQWTTGFLSGTVPRSAVALLTLAVASFGAAEILRWRN